MRENDDVPAQRSPSAPPQRATAEFRPGDISALVELTHLLAGRENRSEILHLVVARLAALLDVQSGGILLMTDGPPLLVRTQDINPVSVIPQSGSKAPPVEPSRPAAHRPEAARPSSPFGLSSASFERHSTNPPPGFDIPEVDQVLHDGQAVLLDDVTDGSLVSKILELDIPCSPRQIVLLPILVGEDARGILYLEGRQEIGLDERLLARAQAIADATAISLGHAAALRLLHEERHALSSARALDEQRLADLARYLDFFESSRDAMIVMDFSGKILVANPITSHFIGGPAESLTGKPFVDLFADQHHAALEDIIFGFSHEQFPLGVDLDLVQPGPGAPDGPVIRTVNVNFSGVMRETGTVLGSLRDVTEEREMARQLAKMRDFLERVIESSPDGIVSTNNQGKILVFNSAAARLFEREREDVVGKMNVADLYPQGVAKEVMARIRAREHGGRGQLRDYRVDLLTRAGERVPVSLSASLVREGRQPVGTFGIFTDVREKLAMEASLSRAQKDLQTHEKQSAIAELAGAAAHELNQPLTSVMGYAEYLKRVIEEDSPHHRAIDVILGETERMAEIVRKVGRLTRYETKAYVGKTKIVDLDASSRTPSGEIPRPRED